MKSVHLQQKIEQELKKARLKVSEPQLKNLALLSHALAVSNSCRLSELALGLPISARRENLIQQLCRYLKGSESGWHAGYGQLVQHLFAQCQGREVALVMDRTDIEQRLSILVVGAAYGKWLLPLNWRVLLFGGTDCIAATHRPLHTQVVSHSFYGDCEFRATALPITAVAVANWSQRRHLCHLARWHRLPTPGLAFG